MKRIKLFFAAAVALLFFAVKSNAQTPASYYAGKWDVLVKGTPQGDVHLLFNITEKDGALSGTIQNPETKKDEPVTKAEIKDDKLSVAFTIMTYDLVMNVGKKDDNHVTGTLADMFEAVGERVK
ncbi:hypothetical protein DYU05_05450 [Mucilaginibacter terrenus]|uniref:Uncharacterized protein n=1 Tax=Mucilaginibacter terrenus TaxID=2482727 RepID=A0A3E2NVV8_9SPHI|nr:hypothetical protein [Mucilaginibacter terrenus]RFZ85051.1 hypothetical protein DYU05_05450 [Mucilaginibacter terrenus]